MKLYKNWHINYLGWKGELFDSGFRFNGGGYLYRASPYSYWRIGPVVVKKYVGADK